MLRTCSNTFTAGLTYLLINLCNTVNNMNCIKRTSLYTASESKTSIVTSLRSTVWNKCHSSTIFDSGVIVILFCFLAGSCTFHKCNLLYRSTCRYTHDLADFRSNRITTDRTLSDRSLTLGDCSGKTGTACVTAATTVVTRKNLKDCFLSRVYFNFEFFSGDSEEKSKNNSNTANYDGCDNNSSKHILFLLNHS